MSKVVVTIDKLLQGQDSELKNSQGMISACKIVSEICHINPGDFAKADIVSVHIEPNIRWGSAPEIVSTARFLFCYGAMFLEETFHFSLVGNRLCSSRCYFRKPVQFDLNTLTSRFSNH
jgi:hypothetical protein